MGATTIEKHFTLDKLAVGPDHAASITPDELKLLVASIRNVKWQWVLFVSIRRK